MKTAIGAFNPSQTASTIDDLLKAGCGAQQISVIAHEAEGSGRSGQAFGDLGSRIGGLHPMRVPDVGEVMATGPFASTLSGEKVLDSLVAAGVPDRTAESYLNSIRSGGALIFASVPDEQIDAAIAVMSRHTGPSGESQSGQPARDEAAASGSAESAPAGESPTDQHAESFGRNLRERHEGQDWATVEPEARRDWEVRFRGTWDRFTNAIRDAWHEATRKA